MMIGIPGSGKSTLAKRIAEKDDNTIILSSDEIRQELYGDESIQDNPAKVFALMHSRTIEALNKGKSVIYDATNISVKSRKGIMQIIESFKIEKEAIIVARPFEDCIKMNNNRKRQVPEYVIQKMYKNFQMPYYFEGFTNIKIEYPNPEDKGKYGHYNMAFKKLLNYEQNNKWHPETLGSHLLDVHCRLQSLKLTDDDVLCQTALLHDIGKPFTRETNKETNQASYFKHANVGAYMSMFYSKLTDPIRTAAIITYHNDTIEWNRNPKSEINFLKKVGKQFYNDVKILGVADHPDKTIREKLIEEFKPKEKATSLNINTKRRDMVYER
jgi:putative nucleotidyltransferase with HDIG domain